MRIIFGLENKNITPFLFCLEYAVLLTYSLWVRSDDRSFYNKHKSFITIFSSFKVWKFANVLWVSTFCICTWHLPNLSKTCSVMYSQFVSKTNYKAEYEILFLRWCHLVHFFLSTKLIKYIYFVHFWRPKNHVNHNFSMNRT